MRGRRRVSPVRNSAKRPLTGEVRGEDEQALRGSVAADEDDDDVDLTTLSSSACSVTGRCARRRGLAGIEKQPALASLLTSSLEALHVSKTEDAFDDDDVDRLCLAFLLPCEDPLAAPARTCSMTRKSDRSCGFYEQTFEAPWAGRAVSATAAHAHPRRVMRPDRGLRGGDRLYLPVAAAPGRGKRGPDSAPLRAGGASSGRCWSCARPRGRARSARGRGSYTVVALHLPLSLVVPTPLRRTLVRR